MSLKRFILATDFSFEGMLAADPASARKMFYLNLFVPTAYEMISGTDTDFYAVLLLSRKKPSVWAPIFILGRGEIGSYCPQGLSLDTPALFDQTYVKHYERITGSLLDLELQSKAFQHAFSDCRRNENPTTFDDECSVLASLSKQGLVNGEVSVTLSVITKLAARNSPLESTVACRQAATTYSLTFKRMFNQLTGEWIGLCDPADENCCDSCKKIYASPQADFATI